MGKNVVVIGTQWGDEGKGKIVDWLTEHAQGVVRFQGGHNAGHTLVIGGKKTVAAAHSVRHPASGRRPSTSATASCCRRPRCCRRSASSKRAGVAVAAAAQDLARRARWCSPYHVALDQAREGAMGDVEDRHDRPRHRSRVRGQDRAPRDPRAGSLLPGPLRGEARAAARIPQLRADAVFQARPRAVREDARRRRSRSPRSCSRWSPTSRRCCRTRARAAQSLLFEGAQGALLDIDHGTYPYVTSSNCLAGRRGAGRRRRTRNFSTTCSASSRRTRRASAPARSRPSSPTTSARDSRKRGNEFGSVTGRPRRCGWLDIPALARSLQLNGVDGLCITKLDVLDGMREIRICTGYTVRGQPRRAAAVGCRRRRRMRSRLRVAAGLEREHRGRADDRRAAARLRAPTSQRIEALTGAPIAMVSTGPDRDETILLQHPFQ